MTFVESNCRAALENHKPERSRIGAGENVGESSRADSLTVKTRRQIEVFDPPGIGFVAHRDAASIGTGYVNDLGVGGDESIAHPAPNAHRVIESVAFQIVAKHVGA